MDNNTKAPSSRGMLIPGRRGKLLANSYLPGGEGPYPLVVLCHGIPGIERLFDFAVALREAGFEGFLIGEAFMKTDNPGKALAEFISKI